MTGSKSTPVKGIHRTRKKAADGTVVRYHYAWRGGPRFWKSTDRAPEGGPDYWHAYHRAVAQKAPSFGYFRDIIRNFLRSREFLALAERTQKDYRYSIFQPERGIDAKFGDAPIEAFNRHQIRRVVYQWRDSFQSPRVADSFRAHLSAIVSWAYDKSLLKANHLSGMNKLYSVDRSEIVWTGEEITLFMDGNETHPPAPVWLGNILTAATETGLRPGDLALLLKSHIHPTPQGQRRIVLRTQKRQRIVSIPVTPRMGALLDGLPADQERIILDGRGKPYTDMTSLGQAVSRRRDLLGIRASEPKTRRPRLYDARGTAATRLLEAGADLREIATAMGWSVPHTARMIETYVAMSPGASDSLLAKLEGRLTNGKGQR